MKTRFLIILLVGLVGFAGIPSSDAFFEGGIVIEVPGQTMNVSQNVISPGETMFVNGSFKQPVGNFSTNIFKNYEDSRKLVLTLNQTTNEFGDFDFNLTIPNTWELGNYYMVLKNGLQSMYWEFAVRQNYSGVTLDRTVYPVPWNMEPPLEQFKDKIPFSEIKCNRALQLTQRYDGSPACVKSETVFELIKRGWVSDIIVAVQSRDVFLDQDAASSYMEKIIPTLDDFRHTTSVPFDIDTIFSKFGPPHNDIGSGIHIYVYELNDFTEVWIGYTDHIWYVKHADSDGNVLEELFVENEN